MFQVMILLIGIGPIWFRSIVFLVGVASFTYSAFLALRMHARPNSTNTCFMVDLVALKAGSFLRYKVDQIKVM